ncbi:MULTISPECIES: hypothetical protein [unclassified Variovorax]|nr:MULTISPECIES: hypothetical protein [unclassified Variovorax]
MKISMEWLCAAQHGESFAAIREPDLSRIGHRARTARKPACRNGIAFA